MTAQSVRAERTLTRPWVVAAAVAALFVALEGLSAGVRLMIFFVSGSGFDSHQRWEILRSEWSIYLAYLVIGLAAAYALRLAAREDSISPWPPLLLRAAVLYVPVAITLTFAVSFLYAATHGVPLRFLGFEVLS